MPDDVPVIYVDGILDVLNLGANLGVTYFAFERAKDGLVWRRPLMQIVRPKQSLLSADGAFAMMVEAQPDPGKPMVLNS